MQHRPSKQLIPVAALCWPFFSILVPALMLFLQAAVRLRGLSFAGRRQRLRQISVSKKQVHAQSPFACKRCLTAHPLTACFDCTSDCSRLQHTGRDGIPTGRQRECRCPSAGAGCPAQHAPGPSSSSSGHRPHQFSSRALPIRSRRDWRRAVHHHDDDLSDVHVGRAPAAAAALSSDDAGTIGAALSAASAASSAASSTALRRERAAAAARAHPGASAGSSAATAIFHRGASATSS